MEIALYFLIIGVIFVLVQLNNLDKKLDNQQSNLKDLNGILNKLSEKISENSIVQSVDYSNNNSDSTIIVQDLHVSKNNNPIVINTAPNEDIIINTPIEDHTSLTPIQNIETDIEPENLSQKTPITTQKIPKKTWWESFREQNPDLEKFVGENLINKIGVLILVLGISYFVKFAIDKNWINETARAGIGILCGGIILGFAHKLRTDYKSFSSVLVAGAIAIFYFTIGIAFHQYHLFSQSVAFVLMVIITAFSVFLSISYNRMELAILSLIGGFSVPFMLSTGEGNYQTLFTYIIILDLGILAIAYIKKWSLVNVLAFIFSVCLFSSWLFSKVLDFPEAPYLGAFVFATLFYIIFTATNIINNLRTQGLFSKIELSILIANTCFYFSAGMVILSKFHPELNSLFTLSLSIFNLICAWFLFKKFGLDKKAIYLLIGFTLTFITLTVPLQFKGNYITLFWAAEAVLLLWLSQKSKMVHFRLVSIVIHFLMLASLILDWKQIYSNSTFKLPIIFNEGFIAGIFATLSFIAIRLLLQKETTIQKISTIEINPFIYKKIALLCGLILLYFTGIFEISYQSQQYYSGFYSPISTVIAFHLFFFAILYWAIQKYQKVSAQKSIFILSLINIALYVVYFSGIAFEEFKENIGQANSTQIAFWMHYISLASIIYLAISVWKEHKNVINYTENIQKWSMWILIFVLVFIASNEVLLHGVKLLIEPTTITNKSNQAILNYQKASKLMIKVAFPILWGILAFSFLIIGIKQQSKKLRIIALTLIGITILKLFVYDISNASETGKIIAFILLGILILIMSFAYQKIKKIVLDNVQPEETQNNLQ
ncbi:MAG: DUF2339 domain-containing protein [Pseudarcicella sp.]|nr:DUF2339 domain-containing protein [Pseudarcicella sp.]